MFYLAFSICERGVINENSVDMDANQLKQKLNKCEKYNSFLKKELNECNQYISFLKEEIEKERRDAANAWLEVDRWQKDTTLQKTINKLTEENNELYYENLKLKRELETLQEKLEIEDETNFMDWDEYNNDNSDSNSSSSRSSSQKHTSSDDESCTPTQILSCIHCDKEANYKWKMDQSKTFCGTKCYKQYRNHMQ